MNIEEEVEKKEAEYEKEEEIELAEEKGGTNAGNGEEEVNMTRYYAV